MASNPTLTRFVHEVADALKDLNGSILTMTAHILNLPGDAPTSAEEADSFIVIGNEGQASASTTPASSPQDATASASAPALAPADNLNAAVVPDTCKWYVVFVGRTPGVFCGSKGIATNIHRIPGAVVEKFDTEEEARGEFQSGLLAQRVRSIEISENILTWENYFGTLPPAAALT